MLEFWPFTNFHDLNLDWIIKTVKEYTKKVDDLYNFGLYDYVERVLAAHPEWTTTVRDGAITRPKLHASLDDAIFGEVKIAYLGSTGGTDHIGNCAVIYNDDIAGIVDFGDDSQMTILEDFLDDINVTKIDFAIISHYHSDHIGGTNGAGIQELLQNSGIDFSDCIWYLPHNNIDWSLWTGTNYSSVEANVKTILQNNSQTLVYPDENDRVNLDANTALIFHNLAASKFANYYSVLGSGDDPSVGTDTDYNNFSMITILKHFDKYTMFTGDLEYEAQLENYDDVPQVDVYQLEHHALNLRTEPHWLEKLAPVYAVVPQLHYKGYYHDEKERSASLLKCITAGTVYWTNEAEVVTITMQPFTISANVKEDSAPAIENVPQMLNAPEILDRAADLNDIVRPGVYMSPSGTYSANLTNLPDASLGGFTLTVEHTDMSTSYAVRQTVRPIYGRSTQFWIRTKAAGSWNAWERYAYVPEIYENYTDNGQTTVNVTTCNIRRMGFTATMKIECSITATANTGWVVLGTTTIAPPANIYHQGVCSNGVPYGIRWKTNGEISVSFFAGLTHTGACGMDTQVTTVITQFV